MNSQNTISSRMQKNFPYGNRIKEANFSFWFSWDKQHRHTHFPFDSSHDRLYMSIGKFSRELWTSFVFKTSTAISDTTVPDWQTSYSSIFTKQKIPASHYDTAKASQLSEDYFWGFVINRTFIWTQTTTSVEHKFNLQHKASQFPFSKSFKRVHHCCTTENVSDFLNTETTKESHCVISSFLSMYFFCNSFNARDTALMIVLL